MNNPEKTPLQEEPSVLDYLKSRLRFWEPKKRFDIPPDPGSLEPTEEGKPVLTLRNIEKPAEHEERSKTRIQWPWRSLLALVFALLGQRAFEPSPDRTAISGLIFYVFSLGWLIVANLRKEWTLSPYPETGSSSETFKVKILPAALGVILSVAAFISLDHNLFSVLNVILWILAIIMFVWAFWLPGEKQLAFWGKIKDIFTRDGWQVKISRWMVLVLVVIGIVVFFRVYNIGGIPSEPFSDHAEKLLDVYDVSQGQTHIFFPRNTGREAIQMYLTLVVSWVFGTGLSFLSLKIGTVICGLVTLPYMYLLGKEYGSKRIGLLAVFFIGIAYWPNVISRAGLRFPLYPLFVAPTLYYLIRGFRRRNRNDFIVSGLFLGMGFHGYSPFRIMPFVVVIAVGLYFLHNQSKGARKQVVVWLFILALTSLIVFLPLARYWFDNPDTFSYRAFSRLGSVATPLPSPWWQIFLSNTWNALRMFNWNNGEIWVHSIPDRPALDIVSGALFLIGIALMLIRYLRQRHWQDLFLVLAVPLLQLPSILSLAFPAENPALNRAAGAMVPAFLLVAVSLDGLLAGIGKSFESVLPSWIEKKPASISKAGSVLTLLVVMVLAGWSAYQNFDLVFYQYATQYTQGAWNSSEMGAVIKQFGQTYGTTDNAWIVPYPYWVDTRLAGVWAGIPNRDFAIWPKDINTTLSVQGPKLFIVNVGDTASMDQLLGIYPFGSWSRFISKTKMEGKDFMIFFVPPRR